MSVFEHMAHYDYGEVHLARDAASGLQAIIAVHDTRLGPALGGCRFIHYDSEREALIDALRLARGMTHKAAITGIPHGGGRSVIMKPRTELDRTALFRAFGKFVDDRGASARGDAADQPHRGPHGAGAPPGGRPEVTRQPSTARPPTVPRRGRLA